MQTNVSNSPDRGHAPKPSRPSGRLGIGWILGTVAVGVVTGVMHGPAGEILEVELASGKEVLIPFVHAIVPDVDLEEGTATITPPEGLLDL